VKFVTEYDGTFSVEKLKRPPSNKLQSALTGRQEHIVQKIAVTHSESIHEISLHHIESLHSTDIL